MKKLLPVAYFSLIALAHSADDSGEKPGLLGRLWRSTKEGASRTWESTRKVGGKAADAAKSPFQRGDRRAPEKKTAWRELAMTLTLQPSVISAGETRVIDVSVGVVNKGKEAVYLDFPTSQRIEVLVKDESGQVLSRWSDDQRVEKEPGFVLINPGERIEYSARISTREMKAGRTFTVESFFPSYDRLRASRAVVPKS